MRRREGSQLADRGCVEEGRRRQIGTSRKQRAKGEAASC